MECHEFREQLETITLEVPDEALTPEIAQHLEGCDECCNAFEEYQRVWLLLSASLPTEPANESLEQRLFDRIAHAPRVQTENKLVYSRVAVFLKYALAASVLIGLTALTLFQMSKGQSQAEQDLHHIRSIANEMRQLNEMERIFASPTLKYISLNSESQATRKVFLVHDGMSKQLHLFIEGLDATGPSELFAWLLTEDEQIQSSSRIARQTDSTLGSALLIMGNADSAKQLVITEETLTNAPTKPSQNVIVRRKIQDFF